MKTNKQKDQPSKEWKIEALENELESECDVMERYESTDKDVYDFAKETKENLEEWLKDIKNDSKASLSKSELELRVDKIDFRIQFHQDILNTDQTLSDDDRRLFKKDLELTETWKKQLKREKESWC